jgi:hypothetical protein
MSMKKTIQYFSADYLKLCAEMTPDQIIDFIENYRMLVAQPTTLIISSQDSDKREKSRSKRRVPRHKK